MAKLKQTILVVDDEESGRFLLRDILVEAGYAVLEARDGDEALVLIDKQSPALLITDRSMPGLGGLELLQKLQERKKSIPSIVVSAYGEESFWGKAIGLGAVDYLVKPFTPADVVKVVQKALGGEKK